MELSVQELLLQLLKVYYMYLVVIVVEYGGHISIGKDWAFEIKQLHI